LNVLIVFAHPDDESYGPGATIAGLAALGARLTLLTFTHGEHSTLGIEGGISPAELAEIRRRELHLAAGELGIGQVRLHRYPDGGLRDTPRHELEALVGAALDELEPALIVTFGTGGISGHPDHITASEVAVAAVQTRTARTGLQPVPIYGWAMPRRIADRLQERLGREYAVAPDERIVEVPVTEAELAAQWRAVQCHRSQHQPPPWPFEIRREVQAGREYLERLLPSHPLEEEPLLSLLGRSAFGRG
jgi:LmbE family N-acetylglucosaminyl deacetylase